MSALFLDSSALGRRYHRDAGSDWIEQRIASGLPLYISALTIVEITAAIARRGKSLAHADAGGANKAQRRAAKAMEQFERDVTGLRVVPVNAEVIALAQDLARSGALRGADAIQLASASLVSQALVRAGGDPLTLISADEELNAAAVLHAALTVENPDDRRTL